MFPGPISDPAFALLILAAVAVITFATFYRPPS